MSYIGTYNACCNSDGIHIDHLPKGSIAVGSFTVQAKDDIEALENAINLTKKIDKKILSLYHVTGKGPNFNTRKIY